MIAANAAGPLLAEPHPLGFRLFGSFAAPLFIGLAGLMASGDAVGRQGRWRLPLERMAFLLFWAAVLDVVGSLSWPFVSFDVLYVLAFAMPVAAWAARVNRTVLLVLGLGIMAAGSAVRAWAGYSPNIRDLPLFEANSWQMGQIATTIARQLAFEGWFPLLPWMGFVLVGASLRNRGAPGIVDAGRLKPGPWLLLAGLVLWFLFPGEAHVRQGYSEIFYPPFLGYCIASTGVFLIVLDLFRRLSRFAWLEAALRPLSIAGRCALLLYLLHLGIIGALHGAGLPRIEMRPFIGLYLSLGAAMLGVAWLVEGLKRRWPDQPRLVRMLLGG